MLSIYIYYQLSMPTQPVSERNADDFSFSLLKIQLMISVLVQTYISTQNAIPMPGMFEWKTLDPASTWPS